jgi:hypothetical protein
VTFVVVLTLAGCSQGGTQASTDPSGTNPVLRYDELRPPRRGIPQLHLTLQPNGNMVTHHRFAVRGQEPRVETKRYRLSAEALQEIESDARHVDFRSLQRQIGEPHRQASFAIGYGIQRLWLGARLFSLPAEVRARRYPQLIRLILDVPGAVAAAARR